MVHPKKNLHFFGTAGKKVYFSLYKIEIGNGMEAMPYAKELQDSKEVGFNKEEDSGKRE